MYKHFFKRVIDFVIALTALAVIWPFLLIVAIWLHFANRGAGAFFTQERPGKDGKIFKVLKFKTMTDERDASGALLPDAQRLTRVGRFVRSTSIDELPQLVNVLKGDMALIGPRPTWKPMHRQPVYAGAPVYTNGVEEALFKTGFCLPAGPMVSDEDVRYIVESIKEAIVG